MREFLSDSSLPVEPSLINSADFFEIKKIVQHLCHSEDTNALFSSQWEDLLNRYVKWEKGFSGLHTSTLNRKLYLYKMILELFSGFCVKNNDQLVSVILSSLPKLGEKIQRNGEEMEVIRRSISNRYGIVLSLRNNAGTLLNEEVFD